jgi:hypothetical protein
MTFASWKQEQWHRQGRMARLFSRISCMNEEDGKALFYLLTNLTEQGASFNAIVDALCPLNPKEPYCVNRSTHARS